MEDTVMVSQDPPPPAPPAPEVKEEVTVEETIASKAPEAPNVEENATPAPRKTATPTPGPGGYIGKELSAVIEGILKYLTEYQNEQYVFALSLLCAS
jgi:hypothetical protein